MGHMDSSEGCNFQKFCPNPVLIIEMADKMFSEMFLYNRIISFSDLDDLQDLMTSLQVVCKSRVWQPSLYRWLKWNRDVRKKNRRPLVMSVGLAWEKFCVLLIRRLETLTFCLQKRQPSGKLLSVSYGYRWSKSLYRLILW